jgi:hypothetical protein
MDKHKIIKVPTTYLPKNWRQIGADKFGCSKAKIEKVVWGQIENVAVFDFMLSLAEAGKREYDAKQQELQNRLSTISS